MSEKKHTGFRTISPERQREIASMGGRAVHERGVGRKWDSETARQAGIKGGTRTQQLRRERMAAATE